MHSGTIRGVDSGETLTPDCTYLLNRAQQLEGVSLSFYFMLLVYDYISLISSKICTSQRQCGFIRPVLFKDNVLFAARRGHTTRQVACTSAITLYFVNVGIVYVLRK